MDSKNRINYQTMGVDSSCANSPIAGPYNNNNTGES